MMDGNAPLLPVPVLAHQMTCVQWYANVVIGCLSWISTIAILVFIALGQGLLMSMMFSDSTMCKNDFEAWQSVMITFGLFGFWFIFFFKLIDLYYRFKKVLNGLNHESLSGG